ncbi:MAG: hypothetical protein WBA13_17650 [Microcoleaceae cyanobacterium]
MCNVKNQLKVTPNKINSQLNLDHQGVRTLTGLTLSEAITDNAKRRLEKTIAKTQLTQNDLFSASFVPF